jgi:protein-S-isoprenylcysteine O-methyltransferase Ste14
VGSRGEWYVVVQAILFALIGFGPRMLPGAEPWPEPWATAATWVGLALMLGGAAIAVAGVLQLGSRNMTVLPYPREEGALVTTGAYAITRNPIYTGLIFGAFGAGLWLHASVTLVFSAGLFVLFDLKSRREGAWLAERYPEYHEYSARVKRLIPWVY